MKSRKEKRKKEKREEETKRNNKQKKQKKRKKNSKRTNLTRSTARGLAHYANGGVRGRKQRPRYAANRIRREGGYSSLAPGRSAAFVSHMNRSVGPQTNTCPLHIDGSLDEWRLFAARSSARQLLVSLNVRDYLNLSVARFLIEARRLRQLLPAVLDAAPGRFSTLRQCGSTAT